MCNLAQGCHLGKLEQQTQVVRSGPATTAIQNCQEHYRGRITLNCHSPFPVEKAIFSLSYPPTGLAHSHFALKVQCREPFRTTERFQSVINTKQWVGIFVGDFIQLNSMMGDDPGLADDLITSCSCTPGHLALSLPSFLAEASLVAVV